MQELKKILEEIGSEENRMLSDLQLEVSQRSVNEMRKYVQGLRYAKAIIRKHMNDGWIPVDKNNVPDHEVLACDKYENELIGYLGYDEDAEEFVCEGEGCMMFQVRAWMEKPEPYHPERSEGE